MAKFCSSCGSPLGEGVKFCTNCGAPVPQAAKPSQPAPAPQPAPAAQPVQPWQQPYQQSWQQPYQPMYQPPKPAKKKGGGKVVVIVLLVVVLLAALVTVGFFGFRDGGWFRSKPSYDARQMQSLLDYAKQLEEAGNSEAAEAVYELIIKGGGAELIEKAHSEIPIVRFADDYKQIKDAFGEWKGGDGE